VERTDQNLCALASALNPVTKDSSRISPATLILPMSDQKAQSDETQQSLAMDVDTQPNGSSNSQFSATAAGSSSAADQTSEMETGKEAHVPKLTRRDIEMNRKQRSLAEFLSMMDNYTPAVS
jgi:hypothetical protein